MPKGLSETVGKSCQTLLSKNLSQIHMNELLRVKASYFSDKAAKLSKTGGVYKVLTAWNKADGGLKILDPGTEKLVTEESKLCDVFLNKFKNKSTDLHNGTKINLDKIDNMRSSGTILRPIIGILAFSLNKTSCKLSTN